MSRLSRTRTPRAILTAVALGVVGVSWYSYHRLHRSTAVAAAHPTPATRPTAVASAAKGPAQAGRTSPDGIPMLSAGPTQQSTPPAAKPPAEPTPATVTAVTLLADAKTKANAGDAVGARKLLNDALLAGGLSEADAAAVKKQLADINAVALFGSRSLPGDPLTVPYKVQPGDRLTAIAKQHEVPIELLMQVNHITNPRKLRSGQSLKVINGPFYAVVTKTKFTIDLYLGGPGGPGSTFVESFPVGLGEDNSTPTGLWEIKNKAPHPAYYSPRGEGVIPAGDPKNPLGPFWLGLEGTDGNAVGAESYGIHGTIDPNSIGKMASMGCIRLRNADIATVYNLLVEKASKVKVLD